MIARHSTSFVRTAAGLFLTCGALLAQTPPPPAPSAFNWSTVVNNGVVVPGDMRKFNSYNQPSISINQVVVFRARSKGGTTGEPAHGVFIRDMGVNGPLTTLFDRNRLVPQPNNLGTMFIEPPSFPRIDMYTNTVATRGGHQPVWEFKIGVDPETGSDLTSRTGTSGIYTNPFNSLIVGVNNILETGAFDPPQFSFFEVPELTTPTKFDVFPGAPAVTDGSTIVFKGNYTVPDPSDPTGSLTISKTGVFYRTLTNQPIGRNDDLAPAGGKSDVIVIADNDTLIPGTGTTFGSTAPPSAAGRKAVFTGWDNEDAPTLGGIYMAELAGPRPNLIPLVQIGDAVPDEAEGATFKNVSEGLSFDGRYLAFWGTWGPEQDKIDLILQCPSDGNKSRVAYCKSLYGDGVNPGTVSNGFHTSVPVHQGIFVHDTITHTTHAVVKSPANFTDFVYWNFSGKVEAPTGGSGGSGGEGDSGDEGGQDAVNITAGEGDGGGSDGGSGGGGGGDEGDDGEPARWRSAVFVAVSGQPGSRPEDANFDAAFKARTGVVSNGAYSNPIDGIYLRQGPGAEKAIHTAVQSGMEGTLIDPLATFIPVDEAGVPIPNASPLPLPVTAMGIERDGYRGNVLAANVTMANEVAGWGGVYLLCATPAPALKVTLGGFRYDYYTKTFVQSVAVTNTSSAAIEGPLSLVIDGLSAGVDLQNATGLTACNAPTQSAYVNVLLGSGNTLAPGKSAVVPLRFNNPAKAPIFYKTRTLAGAGQR